MILSREGLKNKPAWEAAHIQLPNYSMEKMIAATQKSPVWVHFGGGNIFRSFIAVLQQRLLQSGTADCGIIAADAFDYEVIDKIYTPYDNLSLVVSMKATGELLKEVVGSVAMGIRADSSDSEQWHLLKDTFCSPSLQMVSFTITEKGYGLSDISGNLLSSVEQDLKNGPSAPKHMMSVVAALVYERFLAGKFPLALVSMDNCSHNGEKLQNAILSIAEGWVKNGLVQKEFLSYLKDSSKITFPWSMIDKITPRPSDFVKEELEKCGVENMDIVCTAKKTYIAPFVNAEVPQYLVVEDQFPNGRPPLQEAGVLFTDRNTVEMTEKMKVTTCLNPLHTALAVYGCLLGYSAIYQEMENPFLKKLVEKIGYTEGMPVVVDPHILKPMDFIHEVIDERLPNPFIPDTPQRIATDTSQKVGVRFGETIKSYVSRPDLDPSSLVFIPLAIAGWLRYLLGLNDNGEKMELSPDPMMKELSAALCDIVFGKPESCKNQLRSILGNSHLFGLDLYQAGVGEKVEDMFRELIAGPGAVTATLKKYLED